MSKLIDALTSLTGPWVYVMVGLLVAAESAALVGLVIPGEAALLVAGVIASQGGVSLPILIPLTIVAAIVGDSIGYELGRVFGPNLRSTRVGRWVGEKRWDRVDSYVTRQGGPAVFLGRWVGLLRALVPGVAGMTRMPYLKFLVWNVAGAALWAPAVVLAGYFSGGAYRTVERWLGAASILLVVLVVVIATLWFATRWVIDHRDKVLEIGRRINQIPLIAKATSLAGRLVSPAIQWTRPFWTFSVIVAVAFVIIGATASGLVAIVDGVVGKEPIAALDQPVAMWFASHRASWATTLLTAMSFGLGGTGAAVIAATVSLGGRWRRSSWRSAAVMLTALGGAIATSEVIEFLTSRPRPSLGDATVFGGPASPSLHATVAVAVLGAGAWLLAQGRPWRQQATTWSVAVFGVFLVGFARVYLGARWLTDVVGGWLLGIAVLTAVLATDAAIGNYRTRKASNRPMGASPVSPPRDL